MNWRADAGAISSTRPNILFVLVDDQRADTIGALGNRHIETPTLDSLVERGVAFPRAYIMGANEGAVCMPSRCMIQTGRSLFRLPASTSMMRKGLPAFLEAMKGKVEGRDWALLPRVLKAAGYETFHIGKRGNECVPAIEACDTNIERDDPGPEARARSSQAHADAVIRFLRDRKADRPFFIYLAPPVPHDPRVAPKEFMDRYDPAKIPLPPAMRPMHPFDNGEMTVRDEKLAPWPRTPEVIRRHLADYYAAITCFDHHLGRIVECLRALGQLDNTIIIFSSDNGLSIGDHGLMGKQNLYEFGGMHVPLVIAGPGIRRGRSEAFVYLFDLFPTICELAGVPVPPVAEGKSLVPALRGRRYQGHEVMFTAYRDVQRSVRDARWKLICYPQINRTQLFDLKNDPHELRDLAGEPGYAGRVEAMMKRLAAAQREWGDTCPLTVPNPRPAAWSPPPKEKE
ncbi:MAG: sulfatase-like hydrolase/transferase [Verrucomicrobiales bacterium]|nr:sulfatase-like hydrolase/transferase [Verrucomicrobiales bacterium]